MDSQSLIPHDSDQALIPQAERDDIRETLDDSIRRNTRRAYAQGWTEFAEFCAGIGRDPHQASSADVVRFLNGLKGRQRRPRSSKPDPAQQRESIKLATIQARRAAISFRFGGRQNKDNPALQPEVAKLMRGIANQLAKRGRAKPEQARALTLAELRSMCAALPDSLIGIRNRAILTVGFFAGCRRSEIIGLDVQDVTFRESDMQVTITASKTTAVTESEVVTIPIFTEPRNLSVCPARAVQAWKDASGIGKGPLFVTVDKWGNATGKRLHDNQVDLIVKSAARDADLKESDYKRISGHSLRAGVATELAKAGAASWQIRLITRHKSDVMLNRYVRAGGAATAQTLSLIINL